MSIALSTLLYAGFRVAGVTDRPGRTPSLDQYADAIAILNRMIGIWNIDRDKIFTVEVDAYTLTAGKKTYQIGPGGADFPAAARPIEIETANIIVNTTTPVVREPMALLTQPEWAAIQLQDVSGTIPGSLYNDRGNPFSTLYIYGQALAAYQLELYTWQPLQTFAATTDLVVLPPGYEEAIVWNLGIRLAAAFPTQSKIVPKADEFARESLLAIESKNAPAPTMKCDSAIIAASGHRRGGDVYAYLGNTW